MNKPNTKFKGKKVKLKNNENKHKKDSKKGTIEFVYPEDDDAFHIKFDDEWINVRNRELEDIFELDK